MSVERLEAEGVLVKGPEQPAPAQAAHPWKTQCKSLGTWSRGTLGPAGPPPKTEGWRVRTGIVCLRHPANILGS